VERPATERDFFLSVIALLDGQAGILQRMAEALLEESRRLRKELAESKAKGEVRELFVQDVMNQTRCPDCNRARSEWYS
jgi:hypothetical protein